MREQVTKDIENEDNNEKYNVKVFDEKNPSSKVTTDKQLGLKRGAHGRYQEYG